MIICVIKWANAIFYLESKQTRDYLLNASINTIKYLKGLHVGWISPHISHWIILSKDCDFIRTFDEDGLVINILWEHVAYEQ